VSLVVETKIGRKFTVYLPKVIVEALNLKEGERVLLKVMGNVLILESLKDPIQLALSGEKFASITPEQAEAISVEEQARHTESSA
jgi:AbrB family looped-hinge helix DNA binding protein